MPTDEDKAMWRAIKANLGVQDFAKTSWLKIWETKRDLGYPLDPVERGELYNAGMMGRAWQGDE